MRNIKIKENLANESLVSAIRLLIDVQSELNLVRNRLDDVSGSIRIQSDIQSTERLLNTIEDRMRQLEQFKIRTNDDFSRVDHELARRINSTKHNNNGSERNNIVDLISSMTTAGIGAEIMELRNKAIWLMKSKGQSLQNIASILGVPHSALNAILSDIDSSGEYTFDSNFHSSMSETEMMSMLKSTVSNQIESTNKFLQDKATELSSLVNVSPEAKVYKSIMGTFSQIPKCYDVPNVLNQHPRVLATLPAITFINLRKNKQEEVKHIRMVYQEQPIIGNVINTTPLLPVIPNEEDENPWSSDGFGHEDDNYYLVNLGYDSDIVTADVYLQTIEGGINSSFTPAKLTFEELKRQITVGEFALAGNAGYSAVDVEIESGEFELIDNVSVQGNANGELLNADAELGLTLNPTDGYGVSAGAVASGASGEIGSTLSIFGIDLTVQATGRAGAVGIEGRFNVGGEDEK